MSEPKIEFLISSFKMVDKHVLVDGRCSHGPIFKGGRFNAICEIKSQITPLGFGPPSRSGITSIDLEVLSIIIYGKYIEELSEGVTARLKLEGGGVERLKSGMALYFH